MMEQIWSNVKYGLLVICATILLSIFIKGCNHSFQNRHKHEYETFKETTAIYGGCSYPNTRHSGQNKDGAFCECRYEMITYHMRCKTCGDIVSKRIQK